MPSIKTKTASILAITALTVGLTPVMPALADEASATPSNLSDVTGVVPKIIRFQVRRAIFRGITNQNQGPNFVGGNGGVVNFLTNAQQVQSAQQLAQEIEACAAIGCSQLPTLIEQGNALNSQLQNSQVDLGN